MKFDLDLFVSINLIRFSTGLLLALQTDKGHYGHGYGSLVTKALSKIIAEMGYDIIGGVFDVNIASRTLFERLGFKTTENIRWVRTDFDWANVDK